MRLGLAKTAALLAAAVLSLLAASAGADGRRAVVLEIDGAIGPAVADYVVRGLKALDPTDTGLVVLRMDTPGGLGSSMREIIRAMLASSVPVAVYVAPSGARAASAGTYIAYAAGIAAMAPGTNLGAATPIQIGGLSPFPGGKPKDDEAERKPAPDDTESRKILNDAVAFIRSLADLHGRNADWAADAVRNAVSLPANEALKQHVVDVIADDLPDLLRKIDGRTALVGGKPEQLQTAGLEIVTLAPDWRVRLLSVIADPNVAYLFMLLGIYGLIFELANPGVILPGLIGGISLLIALFAFNLLPVDYAGAGLVILGVGLMVAEAFIGSFGAIGLAGIAAFAVGSIIMFRGAGPTFGLSLSVVIAATIVTGAFFLLGLALLLRSRRRRVVTGSEAMIGAEGEALEWQGASGRIRVHGEIWQARAAQPLEPGARIRVTGRKDLVLTVEPM
ncbi:nodulation protein NfeD [Enhydrobacter sp.]|jgi:membrane-bound serine protease (ClpP class)|uniref:NfeD family protein n=1 Tax=Enhydrobacter sp. TaxID=1894999 RepID=UPI00261BF0F3|nr:nodulation protein NfeD [Enhydrobacter sp.]WIM09432.1 MAG: putative membrane-bound ClpP-class protease [Enhydrobacter sp.]